MKKKNTNFLSVIRFELAISLVNHIFQLEISAEFCCRSCDLIYIKVHFEKFAIVTIFFLEIFYNYYQGYVNACSGHSDALKHWTVCNKSYKFVIAEGIIGLTLLTFFAQMYTYTSYINILTVKARSKHGRTTASQ